MKTAAPTNVHLTLRVNGEAQEVSFAPYKTLLEVLREDMNLTGTKHGCELGECGACAVLVDGVPQLSCLVLGLECGGRQIETVEGLANGAEPTVPLDNDKVTVIALREIAEGNITAEMLLEPEPVPVIEQMPENDIDAQLAGFRAPQFGLGD